MKNFRINWFEISVILVFGLLFGVGSNLFRLVPVPWLAAPVYVETNINAITQPVYQPTITTIGLEVAQALLDKDVPFVDARDDEYYLKGHIPTALSSSDLERLIHDLDEKVGLFNLFVIYCSDDDCGSSEDLAIQLQTEGFLNISVFKGGWKEWTDQNLPIESGNPDE